MRRLLALVFLVVAGCGSPSGFNDPDRLAASVKKKVQARIDRYPNVYGKATRVSDVTCVNAHDRVFQCGGELSNGEHYAFTATVSEDGKRYITRGD